MFATISASGTPATVRVSVQSQIAAARSAATKTTDEAAIAALGDAIGAHLAGAGPDDQVSVSCSISVSVTVTKATPAAAPTDE